MFLSEYQTAAQHIPDVKAWFLETSSLSFIGWNDYIWKMYIFGLKIQNQSPTVSENLY